jgi:rare lipoprotein A
MSARASIACAIMALALFLLSMPSNLTADEPSPANTPVRHSTKTSKTIVGRASWYGPRLQGQKTATGVRFDSRKLTAASSRLPLNSRAVVTNLKNGRSVLVKVNDCGPAVDGRKIDLSKQAARKVGMLNQGVTPVKIRVVDKPRRPHYCSSETSQR